MAKIKVYPLNATALRAHSGTTRSGWKLGHPTDGELREGGSYWEEDPFTYCALRDGDITTDESAGWHPKAPEAAFGTPAVESVAAPKKPKLDASGV